MSDYYRCPRCHAATFSGRCSWCDDPLAPLDHLMSGPIGHLTAQPGEPRCNKTLGPLRCIRPADHPAGGHVYVTVSQEEAEEPDGETE